MTEGVVSKYRKLLLDHNDGNLMYRDTETLRAEKTKTTSKTAWFEKKGYKFTVQVPATKNQELGRNIQGRLQEICGDKILLQENFGQTVVGSLKKANPSPPPRCSREDCIPCLHGLTESRCYKNNVGHRIICNWSP